MEVGLYIIEGFFQSTSVVKRGREKRGKAHGRMIISKSVVDRHILEKRADVSFEELLDFAEIELGIDEEGAEVGFEDVGEAFGRGFCGGPVVRCAVAFAFGFLDLLHVLAVLPFEALAAEAEVAVETETDGESGEEFVGDHCHLFFWSAGGFFFS